jgi:Asp-tRNA(Asn)/Glu-tRNA(Gln) amidotransferase A subunit family amidase
VTQLHDLGVAQLTGLYRRKQASPVEAVRAVLAHVERWEPHLKATYALDADAALSAARASEKRWLDRAPLSALDGVPCTIKENIATRGIPTPLGTAATELVLAQEDAPPAATLREAGCVLLAKTTMPDYGMLSSGLSSFHPLTRNPWDLAKNPGGSSAGAAAAAAAGYGPLHVGTDIGGSIRLPAGWCGVVGFKPSLGRIPIHPPYAGRVAGPITRTVDDAARMMTVLTQPDWRDAMSLPHQDIAWTDLERDVDGVRIGLLMDAGWGLDVQPEVVGVVQQAARRFAKAGATVVPIPPFMTREMIDGLDAFWRMRSWLDVCALPEARRARVLPYIVAWAQGAAGLSGADVFRGYSQMAAMRDAAVTACQPFDFVICPVSPVAAYAAELASPTDDPQRPFEHIAFTVAFNMSEQPALALNAGYTGAGLPVGLQIVGRRHDDVGVLRLGRAWERLRPPQRPWPGPPEA